MTTPWLPEADQAAETARIRAAQDLPRGTQPLGPWREGLMASRNTELPASAAGAPGASTPASPLITTAGPAVARGLGRLSMEP